MIVQKFNSEYIDNYEVLITEDKEIVGLCLTLSNFRKINKIFDKVKEELLSRNVAIKSISEPYIQERYYDEYEGLWMLETPSDYSWWELKKQGYVRKFKVCDFEIKEGYKLVMKEDWED